MKVKSRSICGVPMQCRGAVRKAITKLSFQFFFVGDKCSDEGKRRTDINGMSKAIIIKTYLSFDEIQIKTITEQRPHTAFTPTARWALVEM